MNTFKFSRWNTFKNHNNHCVFLFLTFSIDELFHGGKWNVTCNLWTLTCRVNECRVKRTSVPFSVLVSQLSCKQRRNRSVNVGQRLHRLSKSRSNCRKRCYCRCCMVLSFSIQIFPADKFVWLHLYVISLLYDAQLDGSVLMSFLTSREIFTRGKLLFMVEFEILKILVRFCRKCCVNC